MIHVDLGSLYKAEDMEEIYFNKYLLWETNVLPSKFPNYLQDNDNIYTFNKSL